MALVWLQVPEPPGARHTVSLFSVLICGPCRPTFLFLFSLFKFFWKQLNSPGRKRGAGEREERTFTRWEQNDGCCRGWLRAEAACLEVMKEGILFILWDVFFSYERQNKGKTCLDVLWWNVCVCKGAIYLSLALQQAWELLCTTLEICEGHGTWSSLVPYTGFVPQLWALSSHPLAGKSHTDFPGVSPAWRHIGCGLLIRLSSHLLDFIHKESLPFCRLGR